MAEIYSNHLKVVFTPEDICEMRDAILREKCFTVQHFNYESKRRHGASSTYHTEDSTILNFTVRINTPDDGKQLFAHMLDQESHAYSFLFNATFKPLGRIDNYEDAMMATGCIVDIVEEFNSTPNADMQEQMLMHVKLLLTSITFVGKENNLVLAV